MDLPHIDASIDDETVKSFCTTLLNIMSRVLDSPFEEKVRRIRRSSATWRRLLVTCPILEVFLVQKLGWGTTTLGSELPTAGSTDLSDRMTFFVLGSTVPIGDLSSFTVALSKRLDEIQEREARVVDQRVVLKLGEQQDSAAVEKQRRADALARADEALRMERAIRGEMESMVNDMRQRSDGFMFERDWLPLHRLWKRTMEALSAALRDGRWPMEPVPFDVLFQPAESAAQGVPFVLRLLSPLRASVMTQSPQQQPPSGGGGVQTTSSAGAHQFIHIDGSKNNARDVKVYVEAADGALGSLHMHLFDDNNVSSKRMQGTVNRKAALEQDAAAKATMGGKKRIPHELHHTATQLINDIAGSIHQVFVLDGSVGYVREDRKRAKELLEEFERDGDIGRLHMLKAEWEGKVQQKKAEVGKSTVFLESAQV